jgi:replicative DNA helicase
MSGGTLEFERLPRLPPTIYKAQQVVERATQSQLATALSTGIPHFDALIGGYKPGKFILLSGIAKAGKSEAAVDLTVKYIRTHRSPVLFIPLELTMFETLERFPADCHDMLYFAEHFGYTTPEFLDENIRACSQLGVSFVVIDHISAAATSFSDGLQTTSVDALMYQLKALINELDLTLVAVSHTNASCTGIVEPHHLRGSAALVQVPSCIFGVRRLEDGVMELRSVVPDRDTGKLGRINFLYEKGEGFTAYEAHAIN